MESLKPDGHGAEDVEEDEGTIRVVLPEQIPSHIKNTKSGIVCS